MFRHPRRSPTPYTLPSGPRKFPPRRRSPGIQSRHPGFAMLTHVATALTAAVAAGVLVQVATLARLVARRTRGD